MDCHFPRNDKDRVVTEPQTAIATHLVIARAEPVAIHCEPLTEPHCPYASIASSGLPRQSLPFLPRNDKLRLVIARAEPVAIHCEPVSEQTNPSASLETRWIAASLTSFYPRNDKSVVIARALSPWRSTVCWEAKRQTRSRPSRHDGLPCQLLRSFLAMTINRVLIVQA